MGQKGLIEHGRSQPAHHIAKWWQGDGGWCPRQQHAKSNNGMWASLAQSSHGITLAECVAAAPLHTLVKMSPGRDRAVVTPVVYPVALALVSSNPAGIFSGSQLSPKTRCPVVVMPVTVTLYCTSKQWQHALEAARFLKPCLATLLLTEEEVEQPKQSRPTNAFLQGEGKRQASPWHQAQAQSAWQ